MTAPRRPFIGVGSVVWRGEQVLLVRRAKAPMAGFWSIPGGAQELGETVRAAAEREVREETGCGIDILGLIDVVDALFPSADGSVSHHYTLVDFAARHVSGEARPGGDAAEVRWARVNDLGRFNLWSETERVILDSLRFL